MATAGPAEAAIFDAHLLILADDAILVPAREAIAAGDSKAARAGIAADIGGAADFILSRGGLAG